MEIIPWVEKDSESLKAIVKPEPIGNLVDRFGIYKLFLIEGRSVYLPQPLREGSAFCHLKDELHFWLPTYDSYTDFHPQHIVCLWKRDPKTTILNPFGWINIISYILEEEKKISDCFHE